MKSREDVVVGFDTFPEALLKLFRGENFGKLVLQVAEALSGRARRRPRLDLRTAVRGHPRAAALESCYQADERRPYDPGAAALPADLLQAFVANSRDLLALTDATGTLLWANARFAAATGYAGRPATSLLDFTMPGASGSEGQALDLPAC